ncbi:MAG: CBS domain-containing protein [Cyanobacteria bacterium J06639_14]
MSFKTPLSWAPDLEDAIERYPLTTSPDTRVVDAIALISQAHQPTCGLSLEAEASDTTSKAGRASCVLITQGQTILGILTERDVVRLTAQDVDLQTTTVAEVMTHPVVTLSEHSVKDIFAALFLFRRYRIRHVPVVNDQEQLVGIMSHASIRQVLRPANLLRFRRVADVMSTDVIHAPLTVSVFHLAQLMAMHRVSCIVITQPDTEDIAQPVGIVTERDIVQFQSLQINLAKTAAHLVMSSPLFLLSPQDSLWTAHQEMQKRRVGRLVVSWSWGKGLGIVTQTSLLRVFDPMEMYGVIENLQQTLQQLESKQPGPKSSQPIRSQSLDATSHPLNLEAQAQVAATSVLDDRENLLSSLNQIYADVKQVIDDTDSPGDQQQGQLQDVLQQLTQLTETLNSQRHN